MLKIKKEYKEENPRNTTTKLGYLISFCPLTRKIDNNEEIKEAMTKTLKLAKSYEHYAELIKKEYEKVTGNKILRVYPISKTMNGGERYNLVDFNEKDKDIVAFYIVTRKSAKHVNIKVKYFITAIEKELEKFNNYINNYTLKYELREESGMVASYGFDFHSLEEIRKALPKEWENEDLNEYFVND
jgi:hypothetical protein